MNILEDGHVVICSDVRVLHKSTSSSPISSWGLAGIRALTLTSLGSLHRSLWSRELIPSFQMRMEEVLVKELAQVTEPVSVAWGPWFSIWWLAQQKNICLNTILLGPMNIYSILPKAEKKSWSIWRFIKIFVGRYYYGRRGPWQSQGVYCWGILVSLSSSKLRSLGAQGKACGWHLLL